LTRTRDLDLNTPAAELINPVFGLPDQPAFTNPWKNEYPVRLMHLVELTAGSSDLSGAQFNDNVPRTLTEVIQSYPDARNIHWPPGLQHSYTNRVPGLSAMAIEAVSGQSFSSYVDENVLQPLGMHAVSLEPVSRLPGGFKADGQTPIP
jgi:CubicO group peptidase (beta-lactamase class C family)